MKFKTENVTQAAEVLANDHFVAVPYDCTSITADVSGIIKAGTIVPANDETAIGVLLTDVNKGVNPNGTVVIHGFINKRSLPVTPAAAVNIPLVKFN